MAEQSVEIFLIGNTVKRKLVVSHLFSSVLPFVVVLYLLITYAIPHIPAGSVYIQVLVAFCTLIGMLAAIGYYVAWDMGQVLSALAKSAEAQEGFEALTQRGDEIGAVVRSFTETLEMLKKRTDEVNLFSAKLEAANQEMAVMNRKLREMSYTDELTGIYNRRFFNLALEEEIRRAERYRHHFSLAILDIKHFKRINDEHGHARGDSVLAEIGRILKSESRASDVVCRFGGEEFAVILPETGLERAKLFAEKMLQSIRDNEFRLDDDSIVRVTMSVGVSMYPTGGQTLEELVSTADQALYQGRKEVPDRARLQEECGE